MSKARKHTFAAYDGPLTDERLPKEARRARGIWSQQRYRCSNPNARSYAYYGMRGIKVEYSCREFIGWWLFERARNPQLKNPSCGRIDHSKNYRLDNIEMVESAENSNEVNRRLGGPRTRTVKITAITRDKIRLHFDSVGEAARVCGIDRNLLAQHLAGKIKSPIPQLVFRYT